MSEPTVEEIAEAMYNRVFQHPQWGPEAPHYMTYMLMADTAMKVVKSHRD